MTKSAKALSTRCRVIHLPIEGSARVMLEDIVGDLCVETKEEMDRLIAEAVQKARDALDGCECHDIELDGLSFIFNLETR